METRDLRQGNIVWCGYSGFLEVTGVMDGVVYAKNARPEFKLSGAYPAEDLQPIELTTKTIAYFGIEWSILHQAHQRDCDFFKLDEVINKIGFLVFLKSNSFFIKHIKYVHQLQNFIYEITTEHGNRELTFNPSLTPEYPYECGHCGQPTGEPKPFSSRCCGALATKRNEKL